MGGDFESIVDRVIASVPQDQRALVAIDGVGGSGKTTFAAALASSVAGRPVVVVHVDQFFHPSAIRHARGRFSPEGFWLDAYDYEALVRLALAPLSPGGDGRYRSGSFDVGRDLPVAHPVLRAAGDALVLVDGTFLLRDELVAFWDYSIFLDVPFDEAARRMVARSGTSDPLIARYEGGQRLYFGSADPRARAALVVDNTDVGAPRIVRLPGIRT